MLLVLLVLAGVDGTQMGGSLNLPSAQITVLSHPAHPCHSIYSNRHAQSATHSNRVKVSDVSLKQALPLPHIMTEGSTGVLQLFKQTSCASTDSDSFGDHFDSSSNSSDLAQGINTCYAYTTAMTRVGVMV